MFKFVLAITLVSAVKTCTDVKWLEHTIFCCANGSYVLLDGIQISSSTSPSVCPTPDNNGVNWVAIVFLAMTAICCCQWTVCCFWYTLYKLRHHLESEIDVPVLEDFELVDV